MPKNNSALVSLHPADKLIVFRRRLDGSLNEIGSETTREADGVLDMDSWPDASTVHGYRISLTVVVATDATYIPAPTEFIYLFILASLRLERQPASLPCTPPPATTTCDKIERAGEATAYVACHVPRWGWERGSSCQQWPNPQGSSWDQLTANQPHYYSE